MIACVYCGGSHNRPADVKRCWAQQTDAAPEAVAPEGAAEEAVDVVAAGDVPGISAQSAPADPRAAPESTPAAVASIARVGRGPAELGRGVVVRPGSEPPAEWAHCPQVHVDEAALADPAATLAKLSDARIRGETVVIVIGDTAAARLARHAESVEERPQFELGPGFSFTHEELDHLVWTNSVDARSEAWHMPAIEAAIQLGARPASDGSADIVLPDGRRSWVDAGPLTFRDPIRGVWVLPAVTVEHRRLEPPATNVTDADLADDQLAAVEHAGGTARIVAPAGSGKTRVLTERARHLLRRWHLPPSALSLVAFNKRAQLEIAERTSDLAGLQVRTLNAIALAITNGTAPFAPQPRQWRTIDEPDVRRILQRFVQTPRKLNVDPLASWIDALSLVRLGLVDPATVEARAGGDVDGLTEVYPDFLAALDRQGVVDFDDQIRRAIDVLLTQPVARRAAQRACRVLLVDEFQDLTPAHLLLLRLLAGRGGSVFGVGDDDQTIYGYSGADPSWLIDYPTWFPGAGDHPLTVNYRCPADVVEIADRLLRHNQRRVAKSIKAAAPAGSSAGWSIDADADPVAATVTAVREALTGGAAGSEIAVLTRVNAALAPVQLALGQAGIAFAGGVSTEYVERVAVRATLAWLALATSQRFDPNDVGEALRRPSRALHPRVREWVAEQRDVAGVVRLADRITNEKDATRIRDFAGDIGRLQALVAGRASTGRLVGVLVDEVGLGGAVASLDLSRRGMNRAAQGDDLLALRQLGGLHVDGPGEFAAWLRAGLAVARDPGGVMLATVHRVKGQEWPHVVVHLAAADQYPHRLADDVEEERRLFHVAITRAAGHVTIVTGPNASPFVAELTSEPDPNAPPARPSVGERQPGAERAESRGRAATAAGAPDHPLLDRSRVMAVIGLTLVDQGHEWRIVELEPAAAVCERSGTIRRFGLGERVETAGRQRGALTARDGSVGEANVRLFDLLRAFREQARQGKPAYTVFDDKTLAAIADALPADLAALAAVRGVGPAKLEQYGDDVLDLTATAIEP